jgi:hypothetical protein
MNSNDIFKPSDDEYLKCAPSKVYSEGSCFTMESLIKLANAYNKFINDNNSLPIQINNSKADLVRELSLRIVQCNGDQLCWLDVDWIKRIKDDDIHKNTFRPKGPQGRFKWLSTTNINEIMKQYEAKYTNFKFLGGVPYDFDDLDQLGINSMDLDELVENNKTKIGMVINLDEHWKSGSHWVSMYADLINDQIYYFDSYGIKPKQRISNFVKRLSLWCYKRHKLNIQKTNITTDNNFDTESKFMTKTKNKYENILDIKFNTYRHQYKNSECGVYSVNFILRLLNGETFDQICQNKTSDDMINECRKVYFRFK